MNSLTQTTESYKMINFTKINNDSNGNPRYVFHFLALINDNEQWDKMDISMKYNYALIMAKSIGGKKYHNKQYGGGIVIQSYNLADTESKIMQLKNA